MINPFRPACRTDHAMALAYRLAALEGRAGRAAALGRPCLALSLRMEAAAVRVCGAFAALGEAAIAAARAATEFGELLAALGLDGRARR